MSDVIESLLRRWKTEPVAVKRASLLVLAHSPSLTADDDAMLTAIVPANLRRAWSVLRAGPASDDERDAVHELEDWAYRKNAETD